MKLILFLLSFLLSLNIYAQEQEQSCLSDLLVATTPAEDTSQSVDFYYFPWQSVRFLPNLSLSMNMITTLEDLLKTDFVEEYDHLIEVFNDRYSSNHQLVGSQYALQYWEWGGAEIYSTAQIVPGEIPGAISLKRLENGLYHVSIAIFYKFQIQISQKKKKHF